MQHPVQSLTHEDTSVPSPLTLERLNVHQVTLHQCSFRESIECLSRHGITQTGIWRAKMEEVGVEEARRILDGQGVRGTSLVAGGLLTGPDPAARSAAIEDNRRWIDAAAEIGAASMVVITGGLPEGSLDLEEARSQALEGLEKLIPYAREAGIRLSLEPLHPMLCGVRSVLCDLDSALKIVERFDASDVLGLTFDSYVLWWEENLEAKIRRAAPYVYNVHVSDWLPDTRDVRFDRGMPGDGLIDNRTIRRWLEESGVDGPPEVEIFSRDHWWKRPPDEVIATILERIKKHL